MNTTKRNPFIRHSFIAGATALTVALALTACAAPKTTDDVDAGKAGVSSTSTPSPSPRSVGADAQSTSDMSVSIAFTNNSKVDLTYTGDSEADKQTSKGAPAVGTVLKANGGTLTVNLSSIDSRPSGWGGIFFEPNWSYTDSTGASHTVSQFVEDETVGSNTIACNPDVKSIPSNEVITTQCSISHGYHATSTITLGQNPSWP